MNQSTNYNFKLPEDSDFADIGDLTENWDSIDGIVGNVSESIAKKFDGTKSYAVGSYAMYQSKLYRCTTAHSGAWNADDFTLASATEELNISLTYDSSTRTITIPETMGSYSDNTIIFTH